MEPLSDSAGLYIHVPFCLRKCEYCAFYSVAGADSDSAMRFAGALLSELKLALPAGTKLSTFFAGGGTPVLMEPTFWHDVLAIVRKPAEILQDAEMTIEANPAAVSAEDLQELKSIGFNRVSIGVQSFSDDLLRFLGRVHKAQQAEETLLDARKAGFENLGLDLIYGIPGQSPDIWLNDLRSAADIGPQHISCYALTAEDGTPYARAIRRGESPAPDEQLAADLYFMADEFLKGAGYEHYEVSNFALGKRWRCRHNVGYWSGRPYMGFGPSAHSFDGNRGRRWNVANLLEYITRLEGGMLPVEGSEELTDKQVVLEKLMLGLRTADGLDLGKILTSDGMPLQAASLLATWKSEGLADIEGRKVRPSARGMLVADGLAVALSSVLP
jgi:putative oxygen-independent coproporphyrinogen III oxidase